MRRTRQCLVAVAGAMTLAALAHAQGGVDATARWWKGNTHTHTLWSDGDGAPELVAKWYRDHDYDFLVLSDHNILSVGEKWFAVVDGGRSRLTTERLEELREVFGDDHVVTRERADGGGLEMRLKTLDELRTQFEAPGEFIFIQGEEITDSFARRPVHINAANIEELIEPQHGESVKDTIERNLDAVVEHGRSIGRPVFAHVNHPNFQWGLTVEDLAAIRGENFFEVYNGHSAVRNYGDDEHPSTEAMWDIANTMRLTDLGLPLLFGVATDDSHEYHEYGVGKTNPGRGWIMVRAGSLDADTIIQAIDDGDFYASSGVTLREVRVADGKYLVEVDAEEGVGYTTQFIGTRRKPGDTAHREAAEHGPIGEVFLETTENPAVYEFTGEELFVRAKIISSRLHPNPYAEGDYEVAWTQPVEPPDR
ncbi:MAG: histidinol-phosphatase [Phycisphaerales bacterium]